MAEWKMTVVHMNFNLHEMSVQVFFFFFFGAHISQYFICHCLKQSFDSFFCHLESTQEYIYILMPEKWSHSFQFSDTKNNNNIQEREKEKLTNVNHICMWAIDYEQHLVFNHQPKLFFIKKFFAKYSRNFFFIFRLP